jgi:MFS superfamily sulfate permease-like transporter
MISDVRTKQKEEQLHMSNRNQRQSAGHWIFVGIMIGLGILLFQLFALPILVCIPIALIGALLGRLLAGLVNQIRIQRITYMNRHR